MLDPGDLYWLEPDLRELAKPVLLIGLDGFVDAGAAGRLATEHLLSRLEHRVVGRFDVDQLVDYRARRPPMTFSEDHWEDYQAPELALHLVRDTAGVPFLVLSGPEPDYAWERFTTAVRAIVEDLGVGMTVGYHGIPMGVPHTRPLGVTAHASRSELVKDRPAWFGRVQVPGSVAALLELRLGQADHDAVGFAVHVPHYLSQSAYHSAAIKALESVSEVTGLSFPYEPLVEEAQRGLAEIEKQVAESEEVASVVRALERQYDAYAEALAREVPAEGLTDVPTAEELGAQFERFLAEQDDQDS